MAIDVYQQCINPITGETFKALNETPYAYSMLWTVQPKGYVPIEHLHYHQDETFHVQKGQLKMVIEGKEHIAGPGEKIVVMKGKQHIAFNNKEEILEATIEYRPALDQEKFMQCFYGLITDGYIDEKGAPSVPMIGYMLKKMKCKAMARPASIPAPMFKMALSFFYLLGTLKGWGKLYDRYTK